MEFGLHLGTRGVASNPDNLRTLAIHAEKLGFTHLGMSDHLVFARSVLSRYPYSADGKHPINNTGYCFDQITALTFAAAVTSRIRLLTSVMVVPHRPAILTAKMLTTLDVLSKGRVTIGAGVGWLAEEMAALGSPPYDRRGAASNEYIEAFRKLWTEDDPRMNGEFVTLGNIVFEPKPVQGKIPIWIGGEGSAARRRAARLGDGWYPTIRNPSEPFSTPQRFKAALDDVHAEAAKIGRDPASIDIAIAAMGYSLGQRAKDVNGDRVPFTGSAEDIAGDAVSYRQAGARLVIIGFETDDLGDAIGRLDGLASEVMPRVR